MAPCTHPGMKRLFCLKAKNGLGRFSLLVERYMRQGVLILAASFCVRRKTKIERNTHGKFAPPKTRHEIHSSPATVTTLRRSAMKHVPRFSPYSPASIDPGFVEIGLVQLSQSVKTTNVTHTHKTDRPTDRQTDRQRNRQTQTDRLIK